MENDRRVVDEGVVFDDEERFLFGANAPSQIKLGRLIAFNLLKIVLRHFRHPIWILGQGKVLEIGCYGEAHHSDRDFFLAPVECLAIVDRLIDVPAAVSAFGPSSKSPRLFQAR